MSTHPPRLRARARALLCGLLGALRRSPVTREHRGCLPRAWVTLPPGARRRYCLDPRHFETTPFGNRKMSSRRARFLLQSLQDVKRQLRALGSDLLVARGKPEEVLPTLAPLAAAYSAGKTRVTVLAHAEVTSEETAVERAVARAMRGCPGGAAGSFELLWGNTLYQLEDLPFEMAKMPGGFTPFKNKVESGARVRGPSLARSASAHRPRAVAAHFALSSS